MKNSSENQLLAFDKFKKLKVGALFMQMGTGKTKVALELVNYNKVDLLVYITPYSTKNNILKEIEKWGVDCDYKLIGYETISSSDTTYLKLLEEIKNKKVFIIADESIFIKNEESKRYKRLLEIRKYCEYALILNGTPLTKNEYDIYNQMQFLSPLIIKMSKEEFQNKFFTKIRYKKQGQKEHTFYKFSKVNADVLYKLIEPYIFKCDLVFDKEEETNIIYVPYINDDYYYRVKEKKLEEYMNKGLSSSIINMLNALNNISSCYNVKNDKVVDYIKDKQIIVFCNYIEEIEYISSKVDSYVITGDTKHRNEIIESFKNDSKPLIMTYGVGSYSLNLQFCNEIVYSSINFDYAKLEQSKYRIKRLGQNSNIKYTYILTDLGITNLILENLNKKQTLEELIKENMKKGELQWLKNI